MSDEKQLERLLDGAHYSENPFSDISRVKPSNATSSGSRIIKWTGLVLGFCVLFTVFGPSAPFLEYVDSSIPNYAPTWARNTEPQCLQESPLSPTGHAELTSELEDVYASEEFKNRSIEWFVGAIRIPTESYDDLKPVGEDSRWDIFADFHTYLKTSYPKVYSTLKINTVNTYGLVYHWQGSDDALLPILLTGHQDVVPIDPSTVPFWTHPPYDGYYDGEWIWGRGTIDNKNGVIGILSTLETLLESGFKPKRTIVVAFGIDEESSGLYGAKKIAPYLEETYGKDGFALLLDEGGGIVELDGVLVAGPTVAEKGYLDVRVQISTAGGHSSVPPPHTSIGLLAQAITLLEAHPHPTNLQRSSPIYAILQCVAEHAPSIDPLFKKLIEASGKSDVALEGLKNVLTDTHGKGGMRVGIDPLMMKAILSTTQAVDLIEGGVKVNALPERTSAVVNHRIAAESSVDELIAHLTKLFTPFAHSHNLDFISFGKNISTSSCHSSSSLSSGTLEIYDAFGRALNPAPITPTDSAAWKLLSGTILRTHETSKVATVVPSTSSVEDGKKEKKKNMIVAPALIGGNTDTKYYWSLTRNIFRFEYLSTDAGDGAHTVDEKIRADNWLDSIRFYTLLILNADESTDL